MNDSYRIRISMAGNGDDIYTESTSSRKNIVHWGDKAKENYPNHLIIVQIKKIGETLFHDYLLLEDF